MCSVGKPGAQDVALPLFPALSPNGERGDKGQNYGKRV